MTKKTATAQHTPGPWDTFTNAGGHVVHGEAQETIAALPKWDKEHAAEQAANARLIAAAPDMLQALRACLDVLDKLNAKTYGGPNYNPAASSWKEQTDARASIAKAEGRA